MAMCAVVRRGIIKSKGEGHRDTETLRVTAVLDKHWGVVQRSEDPLVINSGLTSVEV